MLLHVTGVLTNKSKKKSLDPSFWASSIERERQDPCDGCNFKIRGLEDNRRSEDRLSKLPSIQGIGIGIGGAGRILLYMDQKKKLDS